MKESSRKLKIWSLFFIGLTLCITSCQKNAQFTISELNFAKPFIRTDTAIYKSDSDQIDTIIFHAAHIDTIKFRDFTRGFYTDIILKVSYELTPKSYHRLIYGSDRSAMDFLSFTKSYNSGNTKEIYFLGLLFNEKYLVNVEATKDRSILFSEDNAIYRGLNINEGIRSFKFVLDSGIVSFVDLKGITWQKVN